MPSKITRRIVSEAGVPGLDFALSEELSPSDLQSLLLDVYAKRASHIRERDLVHRTLRLPLLAPSTADARAMNEFDISPSRLLGNSKRWT